MAAAWLKVGPLGAGDRARWDTLARGHRSFYETVRADAESERAWPRLGAADEDLFVDPARRGRGVARR